MAVLAIVNGDRGSGKSFWVLDLLTWYLGNGKVAGIGSSAIKAGWDDEKVGRRVVCYEDIEHLSKLSCMSRTKFFNEFKQVIGSSPRHFLFQLRLKKAAELLKKDHSVTEACFATGYLNTSHFSRSFKKHFGMNPTEYKTRHCLSFIPVGSC